MSKYSSNSWYQLRTFATLCKRNLHTEHNSSIIQINRRHALRDATSTGNDVIDGWPSSSIIVNLQFVWTVCVVITGRNYIHPLFLHACVVVKTTPHRRWCDIVSLSHLWNTDSGISYPDVRVHHMFYLNLILVLETFKYVKEVLVEKNMAVRKWLRSGQRPYGQRLYLEN